MLAYMWHVIVKNHVGLTKRSYGSMMRLEKVAQGLLSFTLGSCKIVLLCRPKLLETRARRKKDGACGRHGGPLLLCFLRFHGLLTAHPHNPLLIYGRVSRMYKHFWS